MEEYHGKLKDLKLYGYGPAPMNATAVYIIGDNEKYPSYYKFVLIGNALKGYKVVFMETRQRPYPENALMGKF